MIEIMLAEVFIKAALLCLLLYLFARAEADFDFRKVSMVTAALTLGSILLEGLLQEKLGVLTLIPILILTVVVLMKFCWVSWWKALIVAIPFTGASLGMSLVAADVSQKSSAALTRSMTRSAVTKEDIAELKKMHGENTDLSFMDNFSGTDSEPPKPDEVAQAFVAAVQTVVPAVMPESEAPEPPPPMPAATPPAPVKPPPAPAPVSAPLLRHSDGGGEFVLKGISQGPRGRMAMINNVMVEEGQTLEGARVARIARDRVILRRADEVITLKME